MSTSVPTAPSLTGPRRHRYALGQVDERVVWLGLGALLVIRIGLSLYMIDRPGLQQDETLFVNAATLRIPGFYLQYSVHGIPLMVFPYIGALKSWLYAPLYSVFGGSPTIIRLPVVLIVTGGLALLYVGIRDLVNRPVAILAFVVLCFDNSVFWLTRDDVGPSAIEFFMKCAAVFCAARFARTPRLRWVGLLLLSLALGVFNKLNFIWVLNAATAVSVVVIVRYRTSLRAHWRAGVMWGCGLAALYGGFALYYFGDHVGSLLQGSHSSSLWMLFRQGTAAILSGTWFFDYALAPIGPRYLVVWALVALFAVGALASIGFARTRNLAVAGFSLAAIVIVLQILLTPQATAGWHYIAVYPFVTIVAAYGAYALALTLLPQKQLVPVALGAIAALALVYSGALMVKYFRAVSGEPMKSAWSPAIYRLDQYLQGRREAIITTDWGIATPIFALHPGRRITDMEFLFVDGSAAKLDAVGKQFASMPKPMLIVAHARNKVTFPSVDVNLFKAIGPHLQLTHTVNGSDGKPVFEVYAYR